MPTTGWCTKRDAVSIPFCCWHAARDIGGCKRSRGNPGENGLPGSAEPVFASAAVGTFMPDRGAGNGMRAHRSVAIRCVAALFFYLGTTCRISIRSVSKSA